MLWHGLKNSGGYVSLRPYAVCGLHLADGSNEPKPAHRPAYVPYESEKVAAPAYRYLSPALLGEGTDFNRYLSAMHAGLVIFDPGLKVMNASTPKSSVKARSQFRMSVQHLSELYQHFGPEAF